MLTKYANSSPPLRGDGPRPPNWRKIFQIVVLLAIGAQIVFAAKSGLGPFVYPLF